MEKEYTNGQMDLNILETIIMVKNKDMESLNILQAKDMKEIGRMESNKDTER
jgi:hypothetical protein